MSYFRKWQTRWLIFAGVLVVSIVVVCWREQFRVVQSPTDVEQVYINLSVTLPDGVFREAHVTLRDPAEISQFLNEFVGLFDGWRSTGRGSWMATAAVTLQSFDGSKSDFVTNFSYWRDSRGDSFVQEGAWQHLTRALDNQIAAPLGRQIGDAVRDDVQRVEKFRTKPDADR